jgi:pantoate--beta-alanine ligase
MILSHSVQKIRALVKRAKDKGKIVGFVPTMGALHEGHLSLVRAARKECDFVVVSVFVNPTQFGPGEDYQRYPRTFKQDKSFLIKEGVDLVFCPDVREMYPEHFSTCVEEVVLSSYLCGKSRPGHFKGVCTVVAKLFNIVQPDRAYFGQKDCQQVRIIKRMVRDLNFSAQIRVLPVVREKNGLAMSSRNSYLTGKERKKTAVLYRSLRTAKKKIKEGERSSKKIITMMSAMIKEEIPSAKIDYIRVADPDTLEEVRIIKEKVVVALAVYIGKTRLIDNIIVRYR